MLKFPLSWSAICRGAVLKGLGHDLVINHVSKYNYGLSCNEHFVEGEHLEEDHFPTHSPPEYEDIALQDTNTAQGALQKVLAGASLEAVEDLLDKKFANVAQGEYSWLHELVDIGYTTREMAELLIQKSNDTPWIYFEQQKIPNGTVTLGIHIPGCAHQGGHGINYPPRLITTAPDERSLELSGLIWPTKAENLKRIVAEFCGLARIAPTTRDWNHWCGHVRFEDDNSTGKCLHRRIPFESAED